MATIKPPSGAQKWTNQELRGITAEHHGQSVSDGGGLVGKVWASPKGISITFRYGYRWGNDRRWYQCGTWPETPITKIRANRDEAKAMLRSKQEPNQTKQAARIRHEQHIKQTIEQQRSEQAAALTIADLFAAWVSNGIAHKDGNKEVSRVFNTRVLPQLGHVKLTELSEAMLAELYRNIALENKNRTLLSIARMIKQMLGWAEQRNPWRKLLIDGNPATLLKPSQFVPHEYTGIRERVLSNDEIKTIYSRFRQAEHEFRSAADRRSAQRPMTRKTELAVWICLSTLCRIGELSKAEWSHVDLDKREWTIPARNTKAHRGQARTQLVILSDFAIEQFHALKAITGQSRWLFPSEKLGHPTSPGTFSKQIGDRQKCFGSSDCKKHRAQSDLLAVGNENWTLHDLRRTGSTLMAKLGVTREIINLCQNHLVGSSIDRHYLHHDYREQKAQAWNLLGLELQNLLSPAHPCTKIQTVDCISMLTMDEAGSETSLALAS